MLLVCCCGSRANRLVGQYIWVKYERALFKIQTNFHDWLGSWLPLAKCFHPKQGARQVVAFVWRRVPEGQAV